MIGIVILNYKKWELTIECIKSINSNINPKLYKIYIIDNSPVSCKKHFSENLYHFKDYYYEKVENNGYSAGNNIGIKKALEDNCKYILITNNDVIFKENAILNLKNYLDSHISVGIVGPKIYLPSGDIQEINMIIKTTVSGKLRYILRKTPLKFMVKKYLSEFSYGNENIKDSFKVHSVSGCCFMMTAECASQVTPFDEGIFLYEEEIILGVVMEKIGYETVYVCGAEIIHEHGSTTESIGALSYIYMVESEIYYCRKYLNSSLLSLFPLYFIRTSMYLLRAVKNSSYKKYLKKYFLITCSKMRGEK